MLTLEGWAVVEVLKGLKIFFPLGPPGGGAMGFCWKVHHLLPRELLLSSIAKLHQPPKPGIGPNPRTRLFQSLDSAIEDYQFTTCFITVLIITCRICGKQYMRISTNRCLFFCFLLSFFCK